MDATTTITLPVPTDTLLIIGGLVAMGSGRLREVRKTGTLGMSPKQASRTMPQQSFIFPPCPPHKSPALLFTSVVPF